MIESAVVPHTFINATETKEEIMVNLHEESPSATHQILIADDDRMCARIIQSWLVKWGYQVVAVNNGISALELLNCNNPPRLAILDWEMPGMDGPQICKHIRTKTEIPQPYIILLTAREGKEHISEGIRSGANDYLCKPVDSDELRIRLNVAVSLLEKADLELESRRLEKQVEEGFIELALAHANNERILEAMPCLLISLEEQGVVTKWNRIAEELFGMSAPEVLGKPFASLPLDWGHSPLHNQIASCLMTRRPFRLENVSFAGPGEKRGVLDFSVSPVQRSGRDSALGVLILAEDRTAQRSLEAQLAHAQKLEAIGQLAAGIAHEINTPVQYIGDNMHFLKESFKSLTGEQDYLEELLKLASVADPERVSAIRSRLQDVGIDYLRDEIPRAIDQTLHGSEQVGRIVRAMKEFAHPGFDEMTPFDLNAAIETTLTVARNEWKYIADVTSDLDAMLPPVPGYPGEINQALLNLIVNAAHAIQEHPKPNGDKGKIQIQTRLVDGFAEVSIEDDGCGIPEKIRHRIFDPFFTTKAPGKGTGQGLSIVHACIVKRHHGKIRFDSEVGKGTKFTLALPIESTEGEGSVS